MARENVTASKVVTKHNIQINRKDNDSAAKPQLKMIPLAGNGKNMEQITREVAQMQPSQVGGINGMNPSRFNKQQIMSPKGGPLPTLKNPDAQFTSPRPGLSLEDERNMKAFAQ